MQAPYLTQSHNRYSYVMNNPMNYVDPTGYAWLDSNWRTVASVAVNFVLPGSGAVFGSLANSLLAKVITGMISGGIQSGSLKGALTGGLGAGMFHGIGSHFGDAAFANDFSSSTGKFKGFAGTSLTGGQFASKVAAHAVDGGVLGVLNGGKFGHGFASAGVTEALNPAIAAMTEFSAGQYVASMVVGGTTSVIAGGKFANGAVTASFQLAFNHGKTAFRQRGNRYFAMQLELTFRRPELQSLWHAMAAKLNYAFAAMVGSSAGSFIPDTAIETLDIAGQKLMEHNEARFSSILSGSFGDGRTGRTFDNWLVYDEQGALQRFHDSGCAGGCEFYITSRTAAFAAHYYGVGPAMIGPQANILKSWDRPMIFTNFDDRAHLGFQMIDVEHKALGR